MRALKKALELSDYADFHLIPQILPRRFYLRNRYLIRVIRDFLTFSEISQFELDNPQYCANLF